MRHLLAVMAVVLAPAAWVACLPTPQCTTTRDCPPPQTCEDDGWCEYPNGTRLTLYPDRGGAASSSSSGGAGSSSGPVVCVDVAAPRLESNCVAMLDVFNMTVPCVRINFERADFPGAGNPSCAGLLGGKVGGFEVRAATAMQVTATVSTVGSGPSAVRAEQDPAGCNTAQCSDAEPTFNTSQPTRVWVELGALVTATGVSLVLDGR